MDNANNTDKNTNISPNLPLCITPEGAAVPRFGRNFIFFLLVLLVLSFIIIRPLLYGIAWGTVFAFLWRPVHLFFMRRNALARHPNLTAGLSFLLLLVTFTIPLVYTLQAMLGELVTAYESFAGYITYLRDTGLPSIQKVIPESLREFTDPFLADRERIAGILTSLAQSVASFLQSLSKGVLHWTGSFIFQGFIALMTMFFMIRDGDRVVGYAKDFIPLSEAGREHFLANTKRIMNSVAYGVILTVGVQSILGGIGWWVSGLDNAFLASAAMFVFGMFPMGTSVVWLPGSIYLIVTGHAGWGVGLLAWGIVVVSSIDNVLRPLFIGGGGSLPTLAVIIGLSGGIAVWGLLGVFLGPLVLALFLSVLDLYKEEIKAKGSTA